MCARLSVWVLPHACYFFPYTSQPRQMKPWSIHLLHGKQLTETWPRHGFGLRRPNVCPWLRGCTKPPLSSAESTSLYFLERAKVAKSNCVSGLTAGWQSDGLICQRKPITAVHEVAIFMQPWHLASHVWTTRTNIHHMYSAKNSFFFLSFFSLPV